MGQGLRRASWSEGGGGAAGRRASLLGRGRVRTEALRGGGCCRSPETAREQAVCFLVGGNRLRRGGELLFRGEAGFERRLCGAVVAAVPRKRSGNRRCVSWSKGTGCGGAESLSFGERTGSNGCSAGRWLLPLPGNGPGAGGVLLCRREQAAAGRRASLSGRGRIRTRHPSPPLFASAVRCYHPPPAITRRLPPPAACHHPPPATTRRLPPPAACHHSPPATTRRLPLPAARYLRHRCLSPLSLSAFPLLSPSPLPVITRRPLPPLLTASSQPASPLSVAFPRLSLLPAARRYRPPPASFLLPLPVIIRCCLHPRRFSPAATARRNSCLPPPLLSAICHHPLPAISAAMRRPGGQMGCGGTPRGRSGRDASPARSSAK